MNTVISTKQQAAQHTSLWFESYLAKRLLTQPQVHFGVGTGSTVEAFLTHWLSTTQFAQQVIYTASSTRTAQFLKHHSIEVTHYYAPMDIVIDGADEISCETHMVKGGGGALLFEKILAQHSKDYVIMVEGSKIKTHLGTFPIPVEVVSYAYNLTQSRIQHELVVEGFSQFQLTLRQNPHTSKPFITDSGHMIIDIQGLQLDAKKAIRLHDKLKRCVGVVETGLFINYNPMVVSERGILNEKI